MNAVEIPNTISATPRATKPRAAPLKVSAPKRVAKAPKAQPNLHEIPQWKRLRTIAAALHDLAEDNSFTVDSDVVVMLAAQLGSNLNAFDGVGGLGHLRLDGADGWTDVLDIEHTLTLLGRHCAADGVPASVVDFLAAKLAEALDALASA